MRDKCAVSLFVATTVAWGLISMLSGCTAMAPGIQFSNAPKVESQDNEEGQVTPPIKIITPRLVKVERTLREQQVSEDISALLQPAQIYTIEPGDILQIVVWDHPELSASMLPAVPPGAVVSGGVAFSPLAQAQSGFEVDQKGILEFPYAGQIHVAGLTTAEVHKKITQKLAVFLKNPRVTLRMLAYRSKRVYVDGEVRLPGVQAINDIPMTLIEAINRAGGLQATADQSRISVAREGKTYLINLPLLVQRGLNPAEIMLRNGDVVRVLSREESKVFISGEVTAQRSLPMRNGRLSLNEALGEAGGINPVTGDAKKVYVIRRNTQESVVYQLDANVPDALALAEGFELNPKDVVYVAATPLTNWNRTVSAMIPGALPTAVIATTPGR